MKKKIFLLFFNILVLFIFYKIIGLLFAIIFWMILKLIDYIISNKNTSYRIKMSETKKEEHQTDFKLIKVSRVEVIDHSKSLENGGGRAFVKTDCKEVELSYQDDGRTIKIFIK